MSELPRKPFSADALAPDEIEALKRRERAGRDRGAETYLESVRSAMSAFRYRAEELTLLHHLRLGGGEDALEAGAGVGRQSLVVAPRVRRLVCVDFSERALERLAAAGRARGISNLETVVADVCQLPRSLGPFDLVYSVAVLPHVPSQAQRLAALRAFHDVLKPGGRCVVEVPCWNRRSEVPKEAFLHGGTYQYQFTPGELGLALEEAGFRGVSLHAAIVLPGRLTRRLAPRWAGLEVWCSRLPLLAGSGRRLIAVGRRPPSDRTPGGSRP